MNKKDMSERDICTKFINPAIVKAGWNIQTQVREEYYFTSGRITVRGKTVVKGEGKRADYILYLKPNFPIAIIEAKDNNKPLGGGMEQAINYAEILNIPFAFSSNGDGFLFHDLTGVSDIIETPLSLDQFPSPEELWSHYRQWKGIDPVQEKIITQPYYDDGSGRAPRYYQMNAINKTIEAIAAGQNRLILVMATGTGKTYTAFQIIWRLWKSGTKKRILFLADRNILVDQTKNKDFAPFGDVMTKITNRNADKSYQIYLAIYQAVTGTEEHQNIYKQFSPDFFDLIVIDECHRGSAKEDSAWRDILTYFDSATQIGLTATPKETKDVSNTEYFNDPIYTYSLKEGIEDGFLAPYKVVRINMDRDLEGWRPPHGMLDDLGQEIEDRVYNQRDMDRILILNNRTRLVAKKVCQFLRETDPYAKTIIFCQDIDHAERMRSAICQIPEHAQYIKENRKYVMRITGDNAEGKAELDNFIDPESRYPVIATTSKLMTTGVDSQTCKLIVLDTRIQSMTEFKQIIGRGTRLNDDYGKHYFTILDFKNATKLFADPDFDGDPVSVYEPTPEGPIEEPDPEGPGEYPDPGTPDDPPGGGETHEPQARYRVSEIEVAILSERVQYLDPDGKLITESLRDYTRNNVLKQYASLDDFLKHWTSADKKEILVDELAQKGIFLEALAEEVGKEYGDFDLICHVAFDQPPLTRKERAENVKKRDYFTRYGDQARQVLEALLDKYADEGVQDIEKIDTLKVTPFPSFGTPVEIIKSFGNKQKYLQAIKDLEHELYQIS